MTGSDTTGPDPESKDVLGYYSDLLMPISIVVAIQAAILISVAEQEKLNSFWVVYAWILLFFTVGLLGWSFVGHTFEKGVFGKKRAGNGKWQKRGYFFLAVGVIIFTYIMIGLYIMEFTLDEYIQL